MASLQEFKKIGRWQENCKIQGHSWQGLRRGTLNMLMALEKIF